MEQFADDIQRATEYCTYCPKMCRFSCPAAEAEKRETVTPWGMMRLLEFVRNGDVEPSEDVAETFYHCMGCRRCQTWCHHENDVPRALWRAREAMREKGYVPESLDGFASSFVANTSPFEELPPLATVHGMEVDEIFDQSSTVVYVPDCETRYRHPESVLRAGLLLEIFHGTKVALYTRRHGDEAPEGKGCCGFPLLSVGDRDGYEEHRAELDEDLQDADTVVVECAAMAALEREGTSWGGEGPVDVVHLIEFLADRVDFVEPRESVDVEGGMLHDSCFVGRQLELYDETRTLLEATVGESLGEFDYAEEEAPCCGGPSHYHRVAPEASEACAKRRIEQMEREGGDWMVCGSATCKKAFRRAGDDETATDVLDLVCRAFGI